MSLIEKYLSDYLLDLQPLLDGPIGNLQKSAYAQNIPIIKNDVVKLMAFLLSIKKPTNILEIGTAVGFSSSFMAQFLPEGGSITTIERNPKMFNLAKKNIEKLNLQDKINIIEGDAADILKNLNSKFDIIFLDSAKGQYINFLPHIYRLLSLEGIIIADNVLQNGDVAKDKQEIERRQRTIHKRLNEFLFEITSNKALQTCVLPVGDGVALCHKIKSIEGISING